ncbi:MAG: ssDNA-binding domain-containing protein [Eubacterium sp.]|nr:ssDNA-binding domain-containing protein [Eubacterium sp.]
MSNKDKIKAALESIDHGLATINTNEDWISFLRFQSLFYQYSFGNTILIFSQNPEATFVAGYKTWTKLGRYVKRGSKGLSILAPCIRKVEVFKEPDNKSEYHDQAGEKETKNELVGFRVAYVYDIADTDGSDEMVPVLVKGLAGNTETEKELYERLYSVLSKKFTIKEVTGTSSKGSYNLESGIISVRTDLEYLQRIKTLLHEVAHHYDFELNPNDDIPRNRREITAESVSYVVSLRLGLDTSAYSFSYIQSWLKDKDELKIIADTVQKISFIIINLLAESSDSTFSILQESEES